MAKSLAFSLTSVGLGTVNICFGRTCLPFTFCVYHFFPAFHTKSSTGTFVIYFSKSSCESFPAIMSAYTSVGIIGLLPLILTAVSLAVSIPYFSNISLVALLGAVWKAVFKYRPLCPPAGLRAVLFSMPIILPTAL